MSPHPRLFVARLCLAAAVAPVAAGCLAGRDPAVAGGGQKLSSEPIATGAAAADSVTGAGESQTQTAAASGAVLPPAHDTAAESTTIEALRRKSEAYAQALEILLRERDTNSAAPAPAPTVTEAPQKAAPPARGSAVQWLDASQFAAASPAPVKPASPPAAGPSSVAPTEQANPPRQAAPEQAIDAEDSNTPLALADAAERQPAVAMITPNPAESALAGSSSSSSDGWRDAAPADAGPLLTRLSRRVRENPKDVASHLEYQLLLFLLNEQVPNLASIATLPQEDRELVTALLDGISNLRATLRRDANLLIAEKIRPVVELSDRLRTGAELTIPTMTLCSKVDSFGRYEVMEPRFIAGRESATIVYCEIENFSSHFEDGQWQTALSMELSLFTESGQQVYVESPAAIADSSRSRRHDFFVRKKIQLPNNLTIGRYVLKATIVDTQGGRVAESSLPLQVVAQ